MKSFSVWTSFILENKQGLVEPITFVFSLIEVFFLIKNINPRKNSTQSPVPLVQTRIKVFQ